MSDLGNAIALAARKYKKIIDLNGKPKIINIINMLNDFEEEFKTYDEKSEILLVLTELFDSKKISISELNKMGFDSDIIADLKDMAYTQENEKKFFSNIIKIGNENIKFLKIKYFENKINMIEKYDNSNELEIKKLKNILTLINN
jgi:hypothetical protein